MVCGSISGWSAHTGNVEDFLITIVNLMSTRKPYHLSGGGLLLLPFFFVSGVVVLILRDTFFVNRASEILCFESIVSPLFTLNQNFSVSAKKTFRRLCKTL